MKIPIIGSGFSSLSAAAYLSKLGHRVTVFEKNEQIGGRARLFEEAGFKFDMGPSWYWMPEVFENFFNDHNSSVQDHYDLVRLSPSYQVFFKDKTIEVPANLNDLYELFDSLEINGASKLKNFLKNSEAKYSAAMKGPISLPGLSFKELFRPDIIKSAVHLNLTQSFAKFVRNRFTSKYIHQILEFPILFLGSTPAKIPSLYSMLNYADIKLGTWYPMGGMHKVIEGMTNVLQNYGVSIETSSPVQQINIENKKAKEIILDNGAFEADAVVAGADYAHVENSLLSKEYRQYSSAYWEKRALAPSAIIMYLGVKGKLTKLLHHNLFFDADFDNHLSTIYKTKAWPKNPLFYVANPSKTDKSVAPAGHENLFVLIPTAPGLLTSDDELLDDYLENVIRRIKKNTGEDLSNRIVYKKFFAPKNFVQDYNAFKGNAYGLANTLMQTHFLKPRIKHKHINNLFYTGQLTVPGPGVPPSIISGHIVASYLHKNLK